MGRSVVNRRHRAKEKKTQILNSVFGYLKIAGAGFFLLTFIFLIAGFLYLNLQYKTGKSYIYAIAYRDGMAIIKHDLIDNEIFNLQIDGEVGFEASSGLGMYPLKSIYSLSLNEGDSTDLFKKTVMKNLHVPIHDVYDCRDIKLGKTVPVSLVFRCGKGLGVRGVTYVLYGKWKAGKNVSIKNISDYNVLISGSGDEKLSLSENVFSKLEFDFSSSMDITEIENIKIKVPEDTRLQSYVYDVIKVVGGRVVDIYSSDVNIKNCIVSGSNPIFLKNIKRIFGCDTKLLKQSTEIEISFSGAYLESL